MCEFHPRALELLAAQGIDYVPDVKKIKFFRDFDKEPMLGQCLLNSWQLMGAVNSGANGDDSKKIVYVEGMVWGYFTKPVLHAWNSYNLIDRRAADWSQYVGCEWSRYLGIAFTEEELGNAVVLTFYFSIFFPNKTGYTSIKDDNRQEKKRMCV